MNDILKLSPRLSAAAALARGAKRLVDVGTDHGYIPVYFARCGNTESITAADIRSGPLARARLSAEKYGVSEQIEFVLANGLDFPGAELADTVVMAGMGGESVMDILSRAPWTKRDIRLIIQPQTKLRELCLWLRDNGYHLTDALLARDGGRLYVALSAVGGSGGALFPEELLLKKRDPLLPDWLSHNIRLLDTALNGAAKAKSDVDTGETREALLRYRSLEEELTDDNGK